jgi:phospholipase/carboxylesterase
MTNTDNILDSIELNHGATTQYSLIWLHGLGADGNDFVPIVKELRLPHTLGIRFVFPHAPIIPITINNGYEMRAWYDIISLTRTGDVDETGIQQSYRQVSALIAKEMARGIPADHIILAGFSQGAAIAATTGLHYPEKLAGIIALSGYLPLGAKTLQQANPANKQIPIFMAHGSEDPVVPYFLGEAGYKLLEQAGYPVEWRAYPMQHSVCAEEVKDISQWVQRIVTPPS